MDDTTAVCFLKKKQVCERLGVSPATLHRLIKLGKFPPPLKQLGENTSHWPSSDCTEYQRKVLESRSTQAEAA